ncbi:aspartate carbamoyltransferase [Ectothiorhodospiraceae bacterium BW-2]|nr:aspartate carbamoyltransferase [Ectothiorhodospiraceae bacterium BW-2]
MATPYHVVDAAQFTVAELNDLFISADEMEELVLRNGVTDTLANRVMVILFYQPSTRTRLSFEAAMSRLGGHYISTENALHFSSHAKGESLEDAIQTVACYGDVVVLRYHKEGGAKRAARVSPVPLINAGDGPGEHPTQALLDMYTIRKQFGNIDNLGIALVGDLKHSRTIHSLAYLLASYPVRKIYLVSPESVTMPRALLEHLWQCGVVVEESRQLVDVAEDVEVIYTTRLQQEYFDEPELYQATQGQYILTDEVMQLLPQEAIILHPLPRNEEIPYKVDHDSRARYFQQVRNGLYMRMALLERVLLGVD